jgi:hypothetical protein
VSINACATAKGRIAQPLLKGAWLQQSIGCAAVQLHMPARMPHAPLKGAWILVRAAVRTCISIENYRKVYTHTLSVGEIGSLEKQVINTI